MMRRRSEELHVDVLKIVALVFVAASVQVALSIFLEQWIPQPMHAKLVALIIVQAAAGLGAMVWYYGPTYEEGE